MAYKPGYEIMALIRILRKREEGGNTWLADHLSHISMVC